MTSHYGNVKRVERKRYLVPWTQACYVSLQFTCVGIVGFGLVTLALVFPKILAGLAVGVGILSSLVAFVRYCTPSNF